jgi:tRNA(Ile)-lysidine synthase
MLLARFIKTLGQIDGVRPLDITAQRPLGLAVSGGGDSLAMLHLAHQAGLAVRVATVDHGLRAESADEARAVAQTCAAMGYAHDTLDWRGWDGTGNLQDRARRARRSLLAHWAQSHGLAGVALAHTRDDLAEGFIMRLSRGAGVDGLAAMQTRFIQHGALFVRPLLWAARPDLRAYLRGLGVVWSDDPSNELTRFARIRTRKALPDLARLGLTEAVLAEVAQHMAEARGALDYATDALAAQVLTQQAGIVFIGPNWGDAPPELQRRLMQRVILWIAPADYAPRGAALSALMERIKAGRSAQLAGVHFLPQGGQVIAFREAARVGAPMPRGQVWDGLWRESAPDAAETGTIRALGADGLAQWPSWRELGLPRAALLSQPSLWANGGLVSTQLCPPVGQKPPFLRIPAADSLYHMRLSH